MRRFIFQATIVSLVTVLLASVCAEPQSRAATRGEVMLSATISQAMAGKHGSVLVMDVATGNILISYNPKLAAQSLEPPGSTVKPFVLMELLSSGKVRAEQRLICRRQLSIGGRRMDCTHPASITDVDADEALAYSCNTYFSSMATRLGRAELADALRRAGFSSATGLEPNEAEAVGHVATPATLEHQQLQALGEWGVEVTPLELLRAYRSLALLKLKGDLGVAAPVFAGLEHSVEYGMAHPAQSQIVAVAGKTGTASGNSTPQTHGFFAGYAPADKPEIVVIVYLQHARGADAAEVAAPIFTAYWNAQHGAGL